MGLLHLRIERTFKLPHWDGETRAKAMDFWSRRRVVFGESSENTLQGRRGNLLGNLTSFDMTRLMTKLVITVTGEEVHCMLEINRFGQVITQWNRAWWHLELETFESFMLHDDEQDERWEIFKKGHKAASVAWALTQGAAGNVMPRDDKS